MTKKQENKLKMYFAVKAFFDANSEILGTLPNYTNFLAAFIAAIAYLEKANEQELINNTGIRDKLNALKLELVNEAYDLSQKLKAYATFTKNYELIKEVSYTKSELKRVRLTKLKEVVAGLHSRGLEHLEHLAPYGITAELLAALLILIENYNKSIPGSRTATAKGTTYRKQIKESRINADNSLKNIDLAIEIIRKENPAIYNEYKTLRKCLDYGLGTLALKVKIVDTLYKQPIPNARVEFKLKSNGKELLPENDKPIVKKSAEKGGFNIKSMQEGVYEAEVSKNGYQSQQLIVAITNGEMSKLEVELVKN